LPKLALINTEKKLVKAITGKYLQRLLAKPTLKNKPQTEACEKVYNVALHPPGVYGRDGGRAKMLFGAHGLKNHTVSPVGCARACYVAHSTTTAAFP